MKLNLFINVSWLLEEASYRFTFIINQRELATSGDCI